MVVARLKFKGSENVALGAEKLEETILGAKKPGEKKLKKTILSEKAPGIAVPGAKRLSKKVPRI